MTSKINPHTQALHDLGQSLWIDNITRDLLDDGTIKRYIDELSVTGLTSNPTIFEKGISAGSAYDAQIAELAKAGKTGEDLFFELARKDLDRAADLFRPIHDATDGVDGWVSLEVSPSIIDDAKATFELARRLREASGKPNLYIKIPGTPSGVKAIEEAIFAGIPVNVTLLFSPKQYLAAAEAYVRGIERRIEAGLSPRVESVASVFVSRWDAAVKDKVPDALKNRLGLAVASVVYEAYVDLQSSLRCTRLVELGAHPQRLLWASTGTKDASTPATLYVQALAAPETVNTMPDKTLLAVAEGPAIEPTLVPDASEARQELAEFAKLGIDIDSLAEQLQKEGADSFQKSWDQMLAGIAKKVSSSAGAASK